MASWKRLVSHRGFHNSDTKDHRKLAWKPNWLAEAIIADSASLDLAALSLPMQLVMRFSLCYQTTGESGQCQRVQAGF